MLFVVGALMTLGFAPYHFWPVLFISLPLFYRELQASLSRAQFLWRGFFFGYGYSMAGTWWIANSLLVDAEAFAWMLPFSILGLSAVMALWFMALAWLFYKFRSRMTPALFAFLWLLVEVARSIGVFGFPWNLVGYMSLASLSFSQLASIVGVYGLSFILVVVGLLPLYLRRSTLRIQKLLAVLVGILLLAGGYRYGQYRLEATSIPTAITIRVVQPNVPQTIKGSKEGQKMAVESLGRLTTSRRDEIIPEMTIWPETAYPFTLREVDGAVPPHIKRLITGTVRAEGFWPDIKLWNSLVAFDEAGRVLDVYDKHQLVPFGEFVPLRSILPLDKITPGDTDFLRGPGPRTVEIEGLPSFSPLICYEAIFSWMAADEAQRPAWLLNVTNDGWFGDSAGPYQHFEMARMRAIEQGLPMVRAANSGISAVIDPYGRIVSSLPLNDQGVIDARLPAALPITAYATFQNWLL